MPKTETLWWVVADGENSAALGNRMNARMKESL